jgi:asparagine synthase (glutamine-hydrolysing)
MNPTDSGLIGDFICAFGPAAERAIVPRADFLVRGEGPLRIATRGAVREGDAGASGHWLGLADLVEGRLDDGIAALADGDVPQARWRGRFAQVAWNADARRVVALTDHFSTVPLYALERDGTLLLATDLRLIAASPLCTREIDPAAIYHYLNFAYVPAPLTICRDIRHLTPGTRLSWESGRRSETRYFVPAYAQDLHGSDEDLARQLRETMIASVHDYRPPEQRNWGCFLSGGTDSSSIVSMLSSQRPDARVRSFSIGFAEEGYDELGYAELVAAVCNAQAFSARVSRSQAVALVGQVVDAYDQPFGDASAVPTLACAELAGTQGVDTLIAGDGGDEVFGGNERYAKDQVMESFYRLPGPLKSIARGIGHVAGKTSSHFLNRVQNFVERASLPNPDRFYTDDSFGSDDYEQLLTPGFRAQVARDASLDFMREVYALGGDADPLHRIMRLDLLMAIAQNDLYKVHGACRAHGISARFPYLDPRLVEWTGRLGSQYKVRGTTKRYLFKQAMSGILPEAILTKKKQGFGLPIAVWLRRDAQFQQLVRDVLFDPRTLARGVFERPFVEKLIGEHMKGAWDHSRGIWQLVVLELWLRRHLDAT